MFKQHTAIYLRISFEEKNIGESQSISNQRIYIKNYINHHDDLKDTNIIEFYDDGYSGTNDKRPGFQKLIESMKQGQFNTIVVKDLSRFSRDYILLGDYLENILPFMGIRFISINDNYDSKEQKNGTEIDLQFKSLLYDFYAKDCSVKVKSVQHSQKRSGKYLATTPPYGYIKDPNDKHSLLIDEEAAKVIREIFSMYLNGMGMRKIARELNGKGIQTPSQRLKETADVNMLRNKYLELSKDFWRYSSIRNILKNDIYIGTYVFNKYETKTVGGKKKLKKNKNDWERVLNNHEPIIDKDTFYKVQEAIKECKKKYEGDTPNNKKPKYNSPLTGVARCKSCSSKFPIKRTVREHHEYSYFRCEHCKLIGNPKHVCLKVDNYEKKVYESLIRKIGRNELGEVTNKGEVDTIQPINYQKKIIELTKQLDELVFKLKKELEAYKFGEITREIYIERKNEIDLQKENMLTIISNYEELEKEYLEQKQFLNKNKTTPSTQLSKEMVEKYIETIWIDKDGAMEIVYKDLYS